MKYVLKNKQVYDVIFKYFHDEFSDDNLDWSYDDNPDEPNEYNKNIINFNGERYRDGETDYYLFVYIRKEYYERMEDEKFKEKWIDKAPLLDFTDIDLKDKLNSLFGNHWKPVFEKWFESVYPDFPVKTFLL